MRAGHLKLKIQLVCGEEFAMGPGKADLLEAIDREGSISAAGRSLGMSYRRAWLLVDQMNRCFREKLVETLSGGGHERGARVSDAGRAVLSAYRAFEAQAALAADSAAYQLLVDALRDQPLSPTSRVTRSSSATRT
ncbi:MAG: LysR family transcriptional regulator [Sphingomonas bacterium]|nr:LysR family transcriptional regulator [Sphingomonas bacterium]